MPCKKSLFINWVVCLASVHIQVHIHQVFDLLDFYVYLYVNLIKDYMVVRYCSEDIFVIGLQEKKI